MYTLPGYQEVNVPNIEFKKKKKKKEKKKNRVEILRRNIAVSMVRLGVVDVDLYSQIAFSLLLLLRSVPYLHN